MASQRHPRPRCGKTGGKTQGKTVKNQLDIDRIMHRRS
jgi:hypothetical protein